jgi:hypothetical protein
MAEYMTNGTGYAVFRSGIRVSEMVYNSENEAREEVAHWNRILEKYPDGTKIAVKEVHSK